VERAQGRGERERERGEAVEQDAAEEEKVENRSRHGVELAASFLGDDAQGTTLARLLDRRRSVLLERSKERKPTTLKEAYAIADDDHVACRKALSAGLAMPAESALFA